MKIDRKLIRKIQAKHPHEEIDSEGSWAVSYGDMITLLLTFFIIFFSIKPIDNESGPHKNAGLQLALIQALKSESKPSYKTNDENVGSTGAKKTLTVADDNSNQQGLSKKFLEKIKGVAHQKGEQILIEFPDVSFFNTAKIDLTKDGEETLKEFAKIFVPYMGSFQVSIRAFTDNRKVKDSTYKFKDNLELSALRGVAAMRLLQKNGLPLEKIKVGGYGEMRKTMRDIASYSQNPEAFKKDLSLSRKVVLVIEPSLDDIETNSAQSAGDKNEIQQ
jgi:chemotaxis protein MotB